MRNANSSHQLKIGGFPWRSYYEVQGCGPFVRSQND